VNESVPLDPAVSAALTYQRYEPSPAIRGVALSPLEKHRGANGSFMEWLRLDAGRLQTADGPWQVRQVSVSQAAPHRINAFHIHPKLPQSELWTVVQGQLLVWLADCRAGSPTSGARQSLLLTAEAPALLFIPPGVAHGYRAGSQGALLLYAVDQPFDRADPNEGRLPWDWFGAELWAEDRG
jgi:dTDP-4-dehydrorhamnose 3,5-epimerase